MGSKEVLTNLDTLRKLVLSDPRNAYQDPKRYDQLQETILFSRGELARGIAQAMGEFLPDEASILEVAAGTGHLTVALLERGYNVLAFDLHGKMLDSLRQKVGQAFPQGTEVQTIIGDMNDKLPLESASMDAVTSLRANRYIKGSAFYQETHRVLKDGGRLILPIFTVDTPFWKMRAGLAQATTSQGVAQELRESGFSRVGRYAARRRIEPYNHIPLYYMPATLLVAEK